MQWLLGLYPVRTFRKSKCKFSCPKKKLWHGYCASALMLKAWFNAWASVFPKTFYYLLSRSKCVESYLKLCLPLPRPLPLKLDPSEWNDGLGGRCPWGVRGLNPPRWEFIPPRPRPRWPKLSPWSKWLSDCGKRGEKPDCAGGVPGKCPRKRGEPRELNPPRGGKPPLLPSHLKS